MNTKHLHNTILLAGIFSGLGGLSASAQLTFDCGSDGSYGPMEITNNTTLALPPDGKFNCTTITIASGATLRFTANALNTPVYLLATSNVTISGTIDVSGSAPNTIFGGAGGPGGFAGGNAAYSGMPAGAGHGPGGGLPRDSYGGGGSYGNLGLGGRGPTYGSQLLVPLVGGSGGSGYWNPALGGTGGGGAVLVAANTQIELRGSVLAKGGSYNYNNYFEGLGSGGAIRLVAPVITGNGTVNVSGGMDTWPAQKAYGADGRIRIDCMDRRSLFLTCVPAYGYGPTTVGGNMVALLSPEPRLDITQAAGNNIPVGTAAPVFFMLPQGSPTNQTVTVQASNFGTLVSIRVALTPDSGSYVWFDSQIDNRTNNPASVTVPVNVPPNVLVQVNAWTR